MFHEGDLQSGIAQALQHQKAVLCLVTDEGNVSAEWEAALFEESLESVIRQQAVAIKMEAGSHEAGFLTPFCPIESVPAIILIKNAALQVNLQSAKNSVDDVRQNLMEALEPSTAVKKASGGSAALSESGTALASTDTPPASSPGYIVLNPSTGQARLPNNAYDAFREYTEELKTAGKPAQEILQAQLTILGRIPVFKEEVRRLCSLNPGATPELSAATIEKLILRLPAAVIKAQTKSQSSASTSSPSPSTSSTSLPSYDSVYQSQNSGATQSASTSNTTPRSQTQQTTPGAAPPSYESLSEPQRVQQAEYRRIQKEREQKARDERERIKAQIKADREERRRREAVQKQNDLATATTDDKTTFASGDIKSTSRPSNKIRVQVRTFDGTPLNTTFAPTSTITSDIRPWLDAQPDPSPDASRSSLTRGIPYDFKLILTPLPNRKIEAAEENFPLSDLGIKGSCTFVIAPVRGYVESYSGGSGGVSGAAAGLVGGAVTGGYNLVSGTVGAVGSAAAGIARGLFGFGAAAAPSPQAASAGVRGVGRDGDEGTQADQQNNQQRSSARMRTLADQRAEEQGRNQFYNGNTLNFEPNRDDERKND